MRQCTKCGRHFEGNETVCPDDGAILDGAVSFEEQAVGKTLDGKYRIDGFLKRDHLEVCRVSKRLTHPGGR